MINCPPPPHSLTVTQAQYIRLVRCNIPVITYNVFLPLITVAEARITHAPYHSQYKVNNTTGLQVYPSDLTSWENTEEPGPVNKHNAQRIRYSNKEVCSYSVKASTAWVQAIWAPFLINYQLVYTMQRF